MSTFDRDAAVQAAVDAAEAMRTINRSTLRSDDHLVPGVYDIIANLVVTTQRFPQALEQLQAIVSARAERPDSLRADDGTDPLGHLAATNVQLVEAVRLATSLATVLSTAQQHLAVISDQHENAS